MRWLLTNSKHFYPKWIYYKSSEWLISFSWDWNNRLTIADKNLWATQVYNDGDTLSEANCWKMYQRGNNFWFPREWTNNRSTTQVDGTNYWPYYESDNFNHAPNINGEWSVVENNNLWWWIVDTVIARQWPCPEGFHVASKSERETFVNAWITLWAWSLDYAWTHWSTQQSEQFSTYTKIPIAWQLIFWYSDTYWHYWTSDAVAWSVYAHCLSLNNQQWYSLPLNTLDRARWFSIRPFRNEFVLPRSSWSWSWIILYGNAFWNDWIYWEASRWLISIIAWSTKITIADKNLWATQIYNFWDTMSESNCWKFYQWWNNHGFPFNWNINLTSLSIDASNYWPYYYSDTMIKSSFDYNVTPTFWNWSSVVNQNLWWNTTNTLKARRWPCSEWWHVPTREDFTALKQYWNMLWLRDALPYVSAADDNIRIYLKMPYAWHSYYGEPHQWSGAYWNYWSSSCYIYNWNFLIHSLPIKEPVSVTSATIGCSIRPFKNEVVIPDSTRTKLY